MRDTLRQVSDVAAGLDFETRLFAAPDAVAGIWRATSPALVCPRAYARREGFSSAVAASKNRGWPVYQRRTGGGVVPQGVGVANLVLAFNAPLKFTIEDGYRLITEIIRAGLGGHGARLQTGETPGSFCDGAWNLSVGGRKLVGTAQRWRPVRGGRPRVLAHALMLVADNIRPGAEAVAALHADLGLGPIVTKVHTSTEAAFGLTALPTAALIAAAQNALESIHTPNA